MHYDEYEDMGYDPGYDDAMAEAYSDPNYMPSSGPSNTQKVSNGYKLLIDKLLNSTEKAWIVQLKSGKDVVIPKSMTEEIADNHIIIRTWMYNKLKEEDRI